VVPEEVVVASAVAVAAVVDMAEVAVDTAVGK
jgi:hypothetical protein